MGNINFGRVLLGGLLAGLILNIGEFVLNEVVLGSQMKDFFSLHKFAEPAGSFIAIAVVMTFILGIVVVLVYAMIRSRLGPGVKTAIIAGLVSWFGIYVYTGIINGVLFGVSMNLIGMSIVWGLVEYTIAAILGAWVYTEA
jgi:hypothetical protein